MRVSSGGVQSGADRRPDTNGFVVPPAWSRRSSSAVITRHPHRRSLTGAFLAGRESVPVPATRRPGSGAIKVLGAAANNLRELDVEIPLGVLVAVTGVSGAGKSTLVNEIVGPALARELHRSVRRVGRHRGLEGADALDKVITIDQRQVPILDMR